MERQFALKPRRDREWQSEVSEERRLRARQRMLSIAIENSSERGVAPAKRSLKLIRTLHA